MRKLWLLLLIPLLAACEDYDMHFEDESTEECGVLERNERSLGRYCKDEHGKG